MRNLQLNGIDMVLGSNHRSGQIFYAELLVLCFGSISQICRRVC